eukprot:scaffold49163_cov37-Prasinocladus_malaysianus.AAC.1
MYLEPGELHNCLCHLDALIGGGPLLGGVGSLPFLSFLHGLWGTHSGYPAAVGPWHIPSWRLVSGEQDRCIYVTHCNELLRLLTMMYGGLSIQQDRQGHNAAI